METPRIVQISGLWDVSQGKMYKRTGAHRRGHRAEGVWLPIFFEDQFHHSLRHLVESYRFWYVLSLL